MMHIPVLLEECISNLNIKPDGIYVDCTIGYAGHGSHILKELTTGKLYGFDQDITAIKCSDETLGEISSNYELINTNFKNLKDELIKREVTEVDGFLYDLGVSSVQLDETDRGFSYHKDAKLDMRMNQSNLLSAYDVVNGYSYEDLKRILYEYGEEKYAPSIAGNIIKARDKKQIKTTFELVDIIKSSLPAKAMRDAHPARKTFQAIRIEVNNELGILNKSIIDAINMLGVNGRIAVITFHSLEDKIIKKVFKKYSEVDNIVKGFYEVPEEYKPIIKLVNEKVILPTKEEIELNKRARSAKLRVIEKIKNKEIKEG